MKNFDEAIVGRKLKNVIDVWPEVQSLLEVSRMDAVVFTEKIFAEKNIPLYLDDEDTGLWFPCDVDRTKRLISDLGCCDFASDETKGPGNWVDWKILPVHFEQIIEVARAISARDPKRAEPVPDNSAEGSFEKIKAVIRNQEMTSIQEFVRQCVANAERAKAGDQEAVSWVKGMIRDCMENSITVSPVFANVALEHYLNGNTQLPDYLDPSNERYSAKLAATIRAWQAVTDTGGKHPRQAIMAWLTEHAAELGLTDKDGKPPTKAIEECSTVANWRPTGGAPKTPGNNPSTQ